MTLHFGVDAAAATRAYTTTTRQFSLSLSLFFIPSLSSPERERKIHRLLIVDRHVILRGTSGRKSESYRRQHGKLEKGF